MKQAFKHIIQNSNSSLFSFKYNFTSYYIFGRSSFLREIWGEKHWWCNSEGMRWSWSHSSTVCCRHFVWMAAWEDWRFFPAMGLQRGSFRGLIETMEGLSPTVPKLCRGYCRDVNQGPIKLHYSKCLSRDCFNLYVTLTTWTVNLLVIEHPSSPTGPALVGNLITCITGGVDHLHMYSGFHFVVLSILLGRGLVWSWEVITFYFHFCFHSSTFNHLMI